LLVLSVLSSAQIDPRILKINQEIEDIFFQTQNFEFEQDFSEIDELIEQCNHIDYLFGEAQLLVLKCQTAVYLGKEDLIYEWNKSYEQKMEQAIKYGMQDKELYYKFLSLSILTMIDGFEYQREPLEKLLDQARRNNNYSAEAHLLFYFYMNLTNKEQDDYKEKMDHLFSEHPDIKNTWVYAAFQNMCAMNAINLSLEDETTEEVPELSQELQTNLIKAGQLINEKKYKESISLLLKANEKEPENLLILNDLAANYLWLNTVEPDTTFLNKAEYYALKAFSIEPEDEGIHYNLSCVYSQKNNIEKSLYHLEKSLEFGFINYSWMMEVRDLVNMRESVDLEKIIAKYDKWSIAYNHFSEVERYTNKLKLHKMESLAKFRKYLAQSFSFVYQQTEFNIDSSLILLKKVKEINTDIYLQEIIDIWDVFIGEEDYEKADQYLSEYIQTYEDLFEERKHYLKNQFNSSLASYSKDQTFEEYKASYLSEPYNDLAEINLIQSDTESYFKNMKRSIYYEEVHGTSDYLLIDKYTSLATEYSRIDDVENSKKYISKAERSLKRLDDIDGRMLATLMIVDYYFDFGVEKSEILFRKVVRHLNDALEEAEVAENYKYQYWCLVRLASAYHTIDKNKDLQYDYFIRADSLLLEHNLGTDSDYMNWRFFKVMSDYEEYDIIRRITKNNFEYYFSIEEYIKAYDWGLDSYYLYVYKNIPLFEEKDYITLNEMLRRFDEIDDKPEQWSLALNMKKWQIELIHNDSKEEYDNSLALIPQLISMKDDFISEDDTLFMNTNYIWAGKTLLRHISYTDNSDEFQKLLAFIEPLQWNYQEGIVGDNWFLDFINGTYGPFNDTLYTKYINRILSHPLSAERLFQKRLHGNILLNVYGDMTESIRIYEEALLEAKQLGLLEQELIILKELAYRYGSNRQLSLSHRRYIEARELAKALENDEQIKIVLAHMLDEVIDVSDTKYYEFATEYVAIGKKTGDFLSQIQAIGLLLNYFQYIQEPDSAVQYMLEGFSLKDSVITHVSILRYLWFTSECFNYINNDVTDKIVDPIKGWVFDDKKIEDPKLQKIYEEMIYLKDFDFSTLDQEDVNEYPFVYYNTLDNSIVLREYWDGDYLQTDEFKNQIEFLLSLGKKNKELGLLNAFWVINGRIKDLEDVGGGGADKYFGFGFKYDISPDYHGLKPTLIFDKSPSNGKFYNEDVILIDSDEELSVEYAKDFMVSKINEADVLLNKPATFTVLRNNTDTLLIDIMPGDVQPNFYSEYPYKEAQYLIKMFFEISDTLLSTAGNIKSYSGFADTYREFLIAYPWRYRYTHDNTWMSSEQIIELLDRYEQISTYDLVNESIQHKKNIEENPLLITVYNKYSDKINQIQLAMQKTNLSRNEIEQLRISRENAYNELEYFENYSLEHGYTNTELHEFSFIENMDVLSEFDVIIRFCSSGYLNNGSFMWIKDQNQMNYYYTSTENEIEKGIKIAKQILSYSAMDTTLNDRLETSLINLFTSINGNNNAPIFDDNIKNIELNVLVIPEGSTNLFPMELIPLRFESDTTEYYYYGEFANITYAPSLSAYIQFTNRDQEKKKKKKALLVSANPETESTTSYVNNLLAFRSDLGNIEFVDDEIKAISKILSRRKFRKKRATPIVLNSSNVSENKVKSLDLSEYSYIHFASHGVHDDENPKYSGILLGREENDYEDGIFQAHEIFPLYLNAELVVLSSCFSGFGEIDPNEGNLGIYRSFLIAGAKSVIVSLWPVEDESTAILFTKFYEYHQQGKSKAEALRLAKMHLKNETEFSHPFFWAPFVLIGES